MKIKFRPAKGATLSTLMMMLVLLGLGTWQVERLEGKTKFLSDIHSKMEQAAVPLPEKLEKPEDWEYRRVSLAGEFLYDNTFLIKPRTLDGVNGYHMIVPLRRASGGIVLVNRGWISDALMDKATKPLGLTRVEGVVRQPQKTMWTPPNQPEKNDWYWADISAMTKSAKLDDGDVAPMLVYVSERQPDVWPVGGRVDVDIPNDHKQYAIFWYTMALVLLIIYVLRGLVKEESGHGSV